jgi:hypothetical protein
MQASQMAYQYSQQNQAICNEGGHVKSITHSEVVGHKAQQWLH